MLARLKYTSSTVSRLLPKLSLLYPDWLTDTADCQTCDKILEELENIDDDTDKYGIYFVKTDDMEYAKELGVTEVPSLVYFENHSPSIYFGLWSMQCTSAI